jgi:hypothetical protein
VLGFDGLVAAGDRLLPRRLQRGLRLHRQLVRIQRSLTPS